jgi:hypothetical protein
MKDTTVFFMKLEVITKPKDEIKWNLLLRILPGINQNEKRQYKKRLKTNT